MKTTQHTPGPWHWSEARTQQHLNNDKESCFAQVSMPIPKGTKSEWTETMKANAKLIAAAPDMLETLYDAAHQLDVLLKNESCEIEAEQREIIRETISSIRTAIEEATA